MSERKSCPECGANCDRIEVDVGVGNVCGPWACFDCGWEEPKPEFPEMKPFEDSEVPF